MTKVSVLIAVYNTEKYLPECLDSLLNQTLMEWEAICVDDASTDGSWNIMQEYSAKDERIRVIRLSENHGQAYARNQALAKAKGTMWPFSTAMISYRAMHWRKLLPVSKLIR